VAALVGWPSPLGSEVQETEANMVGGLASIEVAELAGRFGRNFVELRHTLSQVR